MKKIQKLIGIILVIMLISVQLIPIINVSAEETETFKITTYGENSDGIRTDLVTNTATLTVNNVTNGDVLSAYKILDAYYNETSNEVTYEFTSDFQAFLEQSTNETYKNMTVEDYYGLTCDYIDGNGIPSASTSVITTSTLNALVSNYTTYLRANSTITGIDMTTIDTTATAEVASGSYLILPKSIFEVTTSSSYGFGFKRNLYGVMVGNVVFTVNEATLEWELSGGIVTAKKESSILRTSLSGASIADYLGLMNGTIETENLDFNMYQNISSFINEKSAYTIEIDKINFPTNAINKSFQVEINFPEGITYDNENFYNTYGQFTKISENTIINKNGTIMGTIITSDKKITIDFNLKNMGESGIGISFDILLNDFATLGDEGNSIVTILTTADDPYVEGSVASLETVNTITTYGLELTSYGEENSDGSRPLLKGAKYEIYTTYDSETETLSDKIGEFEVGEDGTGTFAGVPSGTIYLKQTKAPTGYQLIKEPIAVEIATENAIKGSAEGYYQAYTTNQAMWYLPTTGGVGTIIYTMIGLIIIIISSVVTIKYKKRATI